METQPPFLFLAWAYSMLPFSKRDFGWTLLGLGAALFIAPFLPSLDRQEEAHAFFVSDGYVKGNGVLVGAVFDGELKFALLTCFRLPKDGCDLDSDICPGYALFANDMDDASALSCYSVYSPVLGDPRNPRKQWFSNLYISLPGLGSCLAGTTRRRPHSPLCIVGEDVEPLDAGGRQVRRFQMAAAKRAGGPNSSGSPVLVSMEGEGKSLLAGVVVACNGTIIAFQTLDMILPELRESLQ